MKDNLKVFENAEFGSIRTVTINNEPWFVGKDVAEILGYTNPQKAIRDHVDEDDKLTERIVLSGQNREVILINESGLYSLILSSKLPTAKKFKHWVTSEVLPSIRKNGGYIENQENLSEAEILAKAVLVAQNVITEKNKQIEAMRYANGLLEKQIKEDKPKTIFADAVATSKTSILVGELSKILKQNGIDIGQNRLFKWLRENGYLVRRKGADYNMPTQKSMELRLFEIKETSISHSDGHTSVNKTVKVTGKGQIYFVNKFLKALG